MMRTSRVTVLMAPSEKIELEERAARRGVSSGEYMRLAVDNFERLSNEQEQEMALLASELSEVAPRIKASLERSCAILEDLHRENEAFFKARGIGS